MKTLLVSVLLLAVRASAVAQNPTIDPDHRYLVLATNRTSTMQKELDEAARQGFRVLTGSPKGDEMLLILERQTQPAESYAYRLLATQRTSTMEKELSDAGRDGFRVLPQTAIAKGDEVVVVLERTPGTAKRYEYRLLATQRTSTLEKEINEAGRAGFVLTGTLNRDENLAVMERLLSPATSR